MSRAEDILEKLTLRDKISFISQMVMERADLSEYGMKNFLLADGPSGIRMMKETDQEDIYDTLPLTCYPSASTYASSWDRELVWNIGQHLGREAQTQNVSVLLGPGCNIKRSPLGGRNFEYYSEDPVLTAELATEYIKGLQKEDTGACIKHFAGNNQETRRMTINEKIDERTLHEIYLRAFEKPIKEGSPYMVMTAYNRINGEYGAESNVTLRDILRKEWGYKGCVVTDCFGAHDLNKALINGLNLQMAGESPERLEEEITEMLQKGTLSIEQLDQAIRPTIEMAVRCEEVSRKESYDPEEHHNFARKAAEESMVLLKNKDDFLPLNAEDSIAVIGGMGKNLRFQGGGSSHVNPYRLEQVYESIVKLCPQAIYAEGYTDDISSGEMIEEAAVVAEKCDKVILCMGLPEIYESEGYDRVHMKLPQCQEELLQRILEVNKNVAVVLFNGAPVEMPWEEQVSAVLEAYLPGEAGGGAVANVLFGKVNPSGRLAETFPFKISDTPCYLNFPGRWNEVTYAEGIYVGYRYYDKKEMPVRYPFGYGLSYTTFQYSNLQIIKKDKEIQVSLELKNTGNRGGKEVVQLYIGKPGKWFECPIQELADFQKIWLDAGETKQIKFILKKDSFGIYDTDIHEWVVESGTYRILAGSSSRNISLEGQVEWTEPKEYPDITEHTNLEDMIRLFGKEQQLRELFKDNPVSLGFLERCMSEDPLTQSMGTLMSFHTLRRIDNKLTEEDIQRMLKELNQRS